MQFSNSPVTTMHVDINSCFATVEQQANPLLRGLPVAVAAYVKDYGCILAASREAKKLGVKTGMRVFEGKQLISDLVVLAPDPPKYRAVNKKLVALLSSYTPYISVESIDEMVMKVQGNTVDIAREIKQRIKKEIGEWITVSIGIAPNRYLAKVASDRQKPDGLVIISYETILDIFGAMSLTDFCGIKEGNATRLAAGGIFTPLQFLAASPQMLKYAFHSIVGLQWWQRLHGYEDGVMYKDFEKEVEEPQKTFGQSYALSKPYRPMDPHLWQILSQLVMKMGRRLRRDGFVAHGVGISLHLSDHTHWHTQTKYDHALFADIDFYQAMRRLLDVAPNKPVKLLAEYCYDLLPDTSWQPSLFDEENKKRNITRAIDAICDRFGEFTIHPARMTDMPQKVLDRIAFGKAGL